MASFGTVKDCNFSIHEMILFYNHKVFYLKLYFFLKKIGCLNLLESDSLNLSITSFRVVFFTAKSIKVMPVNIPANFKATITKIEPTSGEETHFENCNVT